MSVRPDLRAEIKKAWRLATAPLRSLPHFLIPGAPKCGTSSVYDWICAHPRVKRAVRKEPTNFIHYPGSVLRSRMHHPLAVGSFVTGEASVEYFRHPDAPWSAASVVPGARLCFLLRDPVARAWSDYQMFRKCGREKGDFTRIVKNAITWIKDPEAGEVVKCALRQAFNPFRYVACGLYLEGLKEWLAHFPKEQMLVIFSEEFFENPQREVLKIYRHLGLEEYHAKDVGVARAGGYSEKIPEEAREMLQEFYREPNKQLAEYLGRELPWK